LRMHGQAGIEERIGFKVALVRVPGVYPGRCKEPSLGLACLCAYLKAGGLECKVFDACFHSWTTYDLVKRAREYHPHLIGLTASTSEVGDAARIAGRLKAETSAPVVVGGPHVTALPRRTLAEFPAFDYGINGEGERPLLHLAQLLRDDQGRAKYIDGIIHRDRDGVTINARPPIMSPAEINGLPFPDFDDYYGIDPGALARRGSCGVLAASRGTPNRDTLSFPVLGREVRWRSADNVAREMERAICRWGAHTFSFCDEYLVYDAEEPRSLLRLLAEKPLSAPARWSAAARPGLIPGDIVKMAKRAGCYRLRLDIGAGDDAVLRAAGRGASLGEIKREVRAIKDAGIEVETYFTLGHPGESEQQIRRTANLVTELNPDSVGINIIIPYPGTAIYEMALRGAGGYKGLSEDWPRYAWYGGKILDVEGLSYKRLAAWRRRVFVELYLRNRRPLDLLRCLWVRKSALGFLIGRKLGIRLVAKERFTG
jgi:anaerobic magnesium-protoporphyrin IX monomethyl ester cyclase